MIRAKGSGMIVSTQAVIFMVDMCRCFLRRSIRLNGVKVVGCKLRQRTSDAVHRGWMRGAGIDQLMKFAYARKRKCQSTLINQSHVDKQ